MGKPRELKPLFLLSDEPISSDAQNAFTDDSFARTIARAALGTKGPFTIGVYGGWGSGKTSALHASRTMIDADPTWSHVVTVEFNAWRYERETHPIVSLVATIERALERKLADPSGISEDVRSIAVKGLTALQHTARSLVSAISFKFKPKIKVPFLAEVEGEVGVAPKDAIDRAEKDAERIRQTEQRTKDATNTTYIEARDAALYLSMFDQLGEFLTSETDLAEAEVTVFPRVVVFIDDLDRCQADKAFELLENVKLVLCQPGFVFVLALNHAVVDGYLSYRAEKLYGKDNSKLHKSYLEKIVQLPLAMPSRSERFTEFATHLLDKRLSQRAEPELRTGLKKLAKVLALSANRTPRSLVRRINTALIDIALRDPATLPDTLKKEATPFLHFSGLCIVQRTLEAALGPEMTRTLAIDNALCEVIAKGNIWGINEALKGGPDSDLAQRTAENGPRAAVLGDVLGERSVPIGEAPRSGNSDHDARVKAEWPAVFDAIWKDAANNFLWNEDEDQASRKIAGSSVFTSSEGKRWLTQHAERRAIMRITVQRPDADATTPASEEKQGDSGGATTIPTAKSIEQGIPARELPAAERAAVEKAIRKHLQLPANAPLGPAEFARVTKLNLGSDPITDAGVAWLADSAIGLSSLTTLNLNYTQVTDEGVKALSRPKTGLTSLTTLYLGVTQVGNEGLKALSRAETGLSSLTTLSLSDTKVTDEGLKVLSRAETGLASLTTLYLSGTEVTHAGVAAVKKRWPNIRVEH